jgi:hypothetical protein
MVVSVVPAARTVARRPAGAVNSVAEVALAACRQRLATVALVRRRLAPCRPTERLQASITLHM